MITHKLGDNQFKIIANIRYKKIASFIPEGNLYSKIYFRQVIDKNETDWNTGVDTRVWIVEDVADIQVVPE